MAKLTPVPHREYTSEDPIHVQLGPPADKFTLCEQTFTVTIKEYLWPEHQPYTEKQIQDWISRGLNPRTPHILDVKEIEVNG